MHATPIAYRVCLYALCALCGAIVLLPYLSAFPSLFLEDDGFFYARIAQNIAQQGFSSFDGLHETSGYHLLWMGVLSMVAKLSGYIHPPQEFLLYACVATSLFLIILTAMEFFDRVEQRVLVIILSLICSLLMEMNLFVLLVLVIFAWMLRAETHASPPVSVLVCVFLLPLARIDGLILLAPLCLYLLLFNRRAGWQFVLACGAGLVTQLLLMQAIFGQPFSVSSMLKAESSDYYLWRNLTGRGADYLLRNLIAAGLCLLPLAIAVYQKRRAAIFLGLAILGFYAAHLIFNLQRHWYFLPVYLPSLYVLLNLLGGATTGQRWLRGSLGVVSLTLAMIFGLTYQLLHLTDRANSVYFQKRVNQLLSKDDIVYQVDGAGWTGFFLQAHLVNGDGLVNSYAYAKRLKAGRLSGYLEDIGANYIITNRPPVGEVLVDIGGLRVLKPQVKTLVSVPFASDYRYGQFQLHQMVR